ncbi:MAG: 3-hydroxyacyl-CoA dehydrogenase NAD-binding domain-containing protein [Desulfosarcinaceae bacterium]
MPRIKKIGIIGAGHMGSGIAQKVAQEGFDVTMVDIKDEYVDRGISTVKKMLQGGVQRRIFTQDQVDIFLSRLKGSTDYHDVADADIVIEAVFEDRDVKTKLLASTIFSIQPKTGFSRSSHTTVQVKKP